MSKSANIVGTSGRSLIYVHGRDFKPAAEDLFELVIEALAAGIESDYPEHLEDFHSLGKHLAYYGDTGNEFLLEKGGSYDEQLDLGDRRNALALLRSRERPKGFKLSEYDRLPGKTALSEFAADVAAPIMSLLGLGDVLLSKVAADVAEYWNEQNAAFGDSIRSRVRDAVATALDREDNVLLVCHGSGCIVAWDVLWQLSHDPEWADKYGDKKIDTLLTLGSPLGDSMVRSRLLGAKSKKRERYPTNILSWHNVSAEDDYVCHDNTCADDYKPMMKQRQISSIRDYNIYNLAVRYGKSNPHSSAGYLVSPVVTRLLNDWMSRSAAST